MYRILSIKEKINNAITNMKRATDLNPFYIFLCDKDYIKLRELGQSIHTEFRDDGGIMIWGIVVYLYESDFAINQVLNQGPHKFKYKKNVDIAKYTYKDMQLIGFKEGIDLIMDQDLDNELYDRDYVFTEEIAIDSNLFKDMENELLRFTNPYINILVDKLKYETFCRIKFISKYRYKKQLNFYKDMIISHLQSEFGAKKYFKGYM